MANKTVYSGKIWASSYWNDVIPVKKGSIYEFEASENWMDWFIPCDANGYETSLFRSFEKSKRSPNEKWFCLIGALDRDEKTSFRIGTGRQWTAPVDGLLSCYANDLRKLYWNNFGSVTLLVHKLDN